MAFAKFMSSTAGRLIRIIAGVALILIGAFMVAPPAGYVVAVIGILPILAGGLNFCLIAPIIGASFWGREIRQS
jgi:uncharacterized membrane protein